MYKPKITAQQIGPHWQWFVSSPGGGYGFFDRWVYALDLGLALSKIYYDRSQIASKQEA